MSPSALQRVTFIFVAFLVMGGRNKPFGLNFFSFFFLYLVELDDATQKYSFQRSRRLDNLTD